ncbi:MAG: GNAT family N-acetyltransferase [Anaerolineae bacterium]
MPVTSRPYVDHDDLNRIQHATSQWIAAAGLCGYLHPADIALRLFNGMRRYAPQQIIRLWEHADGELLGWAMIYPRWDSYEVLVHPQHRAGELAREILIWAENETWRWLRQEGRANPAITLNVYEDDEARITLLRQLGYQHAGVHSTIAQRSLREPIPEASLAAGFSVRPLRGTQEVEKLVEAQNAAFGWNWQAQDMQRVLTAPGNSPERELVVMTPEGRAAAFCYLLLDAHSKLGMFEDVGTHPDFRRRGLGSAMLYAGMKLMYDAGMGSALVPYHVSADAGKGLYDAVGFQPLYGIADYSKAAPTD